MKKNFLRYSKSFTDFSSQKSRYPRTIEAPDLLDLVCEELDEDYEDKESQGKTVGNVQQNLFKRGINLSKSSISKYIRLVQVTYRWLGADEADGIEILNGLKGNGESIGNKNYFEFIRSGIECFKADGIYTLDDLRLRAGKADAAKEIPDQLTEAAEPVFQPVKEDVREKTGACTAKDLIDEAHDKLDELDKIIADLTWKDQEWHRKHVVYLDEIGALQRDYLLLKSKTEPLLKKIEELEKTLESLTESEENIRVACYELQKKLEKAEYNLLEKDAEISILQDEIDKAQKTSEVELLYKIASRMKEEEDFKREQTGQFCQKPEVSDEVSMVIPPKALSPKADLVLPVWSKFYRRAVDYNKEVLDYLTSLKKRDRTKIIKSITFFFDNDPLDCSACNGKKIEGGSYSGCREIKAGKKHRVLLREEADVMMVVKIFRKGQNVSNIKE